MIKEDYMPFEAIPGMYKSESLAGVYASLHASPDSAFYDPDLDKYVVWRYNDVASVLSQKTPGISNAQTLDPMTPYRVLAKHPPNWLHMARLLCYTTPVTANAEGEKHDHIKKTLQTPGHDRSLKMATVQDNYVGLVEEEVDQAMGAFEADLDREGMAVFDESFARVLASRVVSRAIGFGTHSQQRIKYWSDAQTILLGQYLYPNEQTKALKGLADLAVACSGLVKRKRRTGDGEGIAGILADPRRGISIREAGSTLMNLVAAGYSTTSGTLASSVERLTTTDREYWDALPSMDAKARKSLVNELMRLETGLTAWKRSTTDEVLLADGATVIPKGAGIIALIGAANQDPTKFRNPGQIDTERHTKERKEPKQLTFGYGVHLCVGRDLAKLEIETAINALRDIMPDLRLMSETKVYDKDHLFRTPRYILAQSR